jgi:hypothetical protein
MRHENRTIAKRSKDRSGPMIDGLFIGRRYVTKQQERSSEWPSHDDAGRSEAKSARRAETAASADL